MNPLENIRIKISMNTSQMFADDAELQLVCAENLLNKCPRIEEDICQAYMLSRNSAKIFRCLKIWDKNYESLKLSQKCLSLLNDDDSEIEILTEISTALKKLRCNKELIENYETLANIYIDKNRTNIAAKYFLKVADIFLNDIDNEQSQNYLLAENYYQHILILSTKLHRDIIIDTFRRLIQLYILMGKYKDSHDTVIKIFEYLTAIDDIDTYMLIAGLLYIITNFDNIDENFSILTQDVNDTSQTFNSSLHGKFLYNVTQAIVDKDGEKLMQFYNEYSKNNVQFNKTSFSEITKCVHVIFEMINEDKLIVRRKSVDSYELLQSMQKEFKNMGFKETPYPWCRYTSEY